MLCLLLLSDFHEVLGKGGAFMRRSIPFIPSLPVLPLAFVPFLGTVRGAHRITSAALRGKAWVGMCGVTV